MARVTVEDCLRNVKNRFDLVLKASKRSREIERGDEPLVEYENDKPTVLALREIAAGLHKKTKSLEEELKIEFSEEQGDNSDVEEESLVVVEEKPEVQEEVVAVEESKD